MLEDHCITDADETALIRHELACTASQIFRGSWRTAKAGLLAGFVSTLSGPAGQYSRVTGFNSG
jgi:hypothetical protein